MTNKYKNEIIEWIKSIALAVVIAIVVKTFIFNTTYVLGYSMYPTLHERDRLITNKVGYLIGEPKHGDIVVIKAPDDPDKDYIKRIVGLEGDVVEVKGGEVYLNGKILEEDYLFGHPYTYGELKVKVPEGQIFLLGDNRNKMASKDSRAFGTVSVKAIKGKATLRYYPFDDRFGSVYKIENSHPEEKSLLGDS